MRALTKLNQVGLANHNTSGTPPEMSLERIIRDPANPRPPLHLRSPEEQQKQLELNASVKKRGVKSPISLRPHPSMPNMWVINHGHCRYDAAEAVGLTTIPYFVDPNFDSYDQVVENLHRCDLSIWAIAAFIKRKLDEGDSKSQIAEGLGKGSQNFVTEHLALVDAPSCVHQAYANAVRSPRTLYDLRRAHDEFPEQVEEWCNSGARVTRDAIKELLDGLRHDVVGGSSSSKEVSSLQPRSMTQTQGEPDTADQDDPGPTLEDAKSLLRHDVIPAAQTQKIPASVLKPPRQTKSPGAAPKSSTTLDLVQPSATPADIVVRYRGRRGRVVAGSTVKILVEGDVQPLEVPLGDLVFEFGSNGGAVAESDESNKGGSV